MKSALGLIETIGLVTAIEAADAAVKAAQITLLGYENTKGGGKITVKFVGEVGAVKAAEAAGVAAALRIGNVYSHHVIPRPHEEIDALIRNLDRGRGRAKPEPPAPQPVAPPAPSAVVEPPAAPEAPERAITVAPESAPVVPEPLAAESLVAAPAAWAAATVEPAVESFAPVADLPVSPRQCIAISKNGEQCKRAAQAGSDYCYRHRPQDDNGGQAAA
jgi:microcompartment protein CcmL/EutN